MKKSHKELAIGGTIAIVTTVLGSLFGEKILEKARAHGFLKSHIAGEDDMGSDNDPIIKCAKNLD